MSILLVLLRPKVQSHSGGQVHIDELSRQQASLLEFSLIRILV